MKNYFSIPPQCIMNIKQEIPAQCTFIIFHMLKSCRPRQGFIHGFECLMALGFLQKHKPGERCSQHVCTTIWWNNFLYFNHSLQINGWHKSVVFLDWFSSSHFGIITINVLLIFLFFIKADNLSLISEVYMSWFILHPQCHKTFKKNLIN